MNIKTFSLLIISLTIASSAYAQPESRRDPTRPAEITSLNANTVMGNFSVSAILIATNRQVAIIDGQFVKAGDEINGATVVSIKPNTVELNRDGQQLTRYLINNKTINISIKTKE